MIVFSLSSCPNLLKPYKLKITEGCELTRIALKEHENNVTKMVKIAINLLKKQSPNLRLIISFADSEQGHLGKIYQAGNWVYTGMTKTKKDFIDDKGKIFHSRHPKYKLKRIKRQPKFRYLYPLDNEMRKQIEPLRKPYPKKIENAVIV